MTTFSSADFLLPDPVKVPSIEKWAVIACDQFTSEPEYWKRVRETAGDAYCACNLILPEAELSIRNEDYIKQIHANMAGYLKEDIYKKYPGSLIYVERVQSDGSVRKGIVGTIDLEAYDFSADSTSLIRATEKTVIERIPPRVAVREGAPSELSHVILYADDEKDALIGPVTAAKDKLKCLYDFDLMLGGGHICGYLIEGELLEHFMKALKDYYAVQDQKAESAGVSPVYFTVADGNHSLASAKVCYENAKKAYAEEQAEKADSGEKAENSEAAKAAELANLRMAAVELENLHDKAQVILPIHRLMTDTDTEKFISDMTVALGRTGSAAAAIGRTGSADAAETEGETAAVAEEKAVILPWLTARESGEIVLRAENAGDAIVDIQTFIDKYLEENGGKVDYIHGDDSLKQLSKAEKTVGLMMPAIRKDGFFNNIMKSGVYPRKTFSVGEATDKRYYLEVRDLYQAGC